MARNIKKKRVPKKVKNVKKEEGTSKSVEQSAKVWQPGVDKLEEGEELTFDKSAYDCMHAFDIGWPCLSFDIIRDTLGLMRTEFPHGFYCVAGTQADLAVNNAIGIFRLSNVTGKNRNLHKSLDDDESESDSSSDEDDIDDDSSMESKIPTLQVRKVAHQGCVNRIRSMEQQPHIVATWSDNGYVQKISNFGLVSSYSIMEYAREWWTARRQDMSSASSLSAITTPNAIAEHRAKQYSHDGVKAGAKAATIAFIASAIPLVMGARAIPWVRTKLNYAAQAHIISLVSGAAYFVVADKTILASARRNSFENLESHVEFPL